MALMTRLAQLFRADMHAVLDRIEEPELLLKQAIREMEETLFHDERRIKLQEIEQQKRVDKEKDTNQSLLELEDPLSLCFKSDKDDLAYKLVKRKLETTAYLKSLTIAITKSSDTINQLKTQLKEQQDQLNGMKQKADVFNQDNALNNEIANGKSDPFSIQGEEIEVALLHEKQKWSQS